MTKKHTTKYARSTPNPVQQTSTAAAASVQEMKAPRMSRRIVDDNDFKPDYAPIVQDLKRIGILACSFFVVLLVLSFIL